MVSIDNGNFQWVPVTDRYVKQFVRDNVDFVIGDSSKYDNFTLDVDVVFIDGDHSRTGVEKDFNHWLPRVKKGGDIVFHDMNLVSVRSFVETIGLEKVPAVGTLAHFINE